MRNVKFLFAMLVTAFTLNQACEATADPKASSPAIKQLQAIKRAIIGSQPVNLNENLSGSLEEEYGTIRAGEATKVDVPLSKSYLDLIYAIAAADGELSASEEERITQILQAAMKEKLSPQERKEVLDYNSHCIQRARIGEYKDSDLLALVDAHIKNARAIGYTEEDLFQSVVRLVLLDAIEAARIDGYAEEEREMAKQAANNLHIPQKVFQFINQYCRFKTLLNRYPVLDKDKTFLSDIQQLSEATSKFFNNK